jgi:hypothetical protein
MMCRPSTVMFSSNVLVNAPLLSSTCVNDPYSSTFLRNTSLPKMSEVWLPRKTVSAIL